MFVCTQVASRRSLRPLVTFACAASCTTRSLRACSVSGCKVLAKPDEGGIIGHRGPVQTTEPAQDQVLIHLLFSFLVTPLMQVLDDEQTQDDFHRGRMAPMHQRPAIPLAKVRPHLLVELVILKPLIEFFK